MHLIQNSAPEPAVDNVTELSDKEISRKLYEIFSAVKALADGDVHFEEMLLSLYQEVSRLDDALMSKVIYLREQLYQIDRAHSHENYPVRAAHEKMLARIENKKIKLERLIEENKIKRGLLKEARSIINVRFNQLTIRSYPLRH